MSIKRIEIDCTKCGRTGIIYPENRAESCPKCNGTGKIRKPINISALVGSDYD